jgi:hypothetical protein
MENNDVKCFCFDINNRLIDTEIQEKCINDYIDRYGLKGKYQYYKTNDTHGSG